MLCVCSMLLASAFSCGTFKHGLHTEVCLPTAEGVQCPETGLQGFDGYVALSYEHLKEIIEALGHE
jgi:hypothetical protein